MKIAVDLSWDVDFVTTALPLNWTAFDYLPEEVKVIEEVRDAAFLGASYQLDKHSTEMRRDTLDSVRTRASTLFAKKGVGHGVERLI